MYVLLQVECAVSDQQEKNDFFEWDPHGVHKNVHY